MLRVCFAASGEHLTVDGEPETVLALKQLLQKRCECSRFRMRVLCGGEELDDDCVPCGELELLLLNHLEADEEREKEFGYACFLGDVEKVEKALRGLQEWHESVHKGMIMKHMGHGLN